MFTEGIFPIGDGLLDIDEARLKSLLVQDDINEIYDIEQNPFARGKFAAVRRAVHKNSGVHFAAKFLKRRRRAQSSDKEIKHEIAVLTLCDGAENIVKLNAVHESRSDTALLLELATGGELQTLLDNEECLNEAHARYCMREVLKALQFLHKRSIAHLDLKPQNILLIGEQIEDGLKLCDFGISRVVAEGTNVREILGTPDYVAPEVLQYEPLSLLTDIWSVGVLTYVLLSGFSPFGGDTKQETFLNISQCALTFPDKLFNGVSAAAIDFIRRALRIKPSDRMTAAGCLEHFWLKDECSIGRQMLQNEHETDLVVDADVDEDDDEDEEEDEERDISIETYENAEIEELEEEAEEFDFSSDENCAIVNGLKATTNGALKNRKITTATTTTTAVHTVPAVRATTIPLSYAQQQQKPQQQQQQTARRHSTDSNKENTYLSSKKILPTNNVVMPIGKKSAPINCNNNKKSTATIIIGTDKEQQHHQQQHHQQQEMEASNIIATIKLPNGCNSAAPSLFPDAPTTPKVIRKAPNTDDDESDDDGDKINAGNNSDNSAHDNSGDASPTSVKALVKKFQLESNAADKHLKETSCNHHHHQQQQQHLSHQFADGPRKSLPTNLNGKMAATLAISTNGAMKKIANKSTNGHHQEYYVNNNNSKHINSMLTNGSRRLSEPLTAVHQHQHHQQSKKSSSNSFSTKSTPSPPLSPHSTASDTATAAAAATMSYRTTCVYCLTCGSASNTNGTTTSSADCCYSVELNGAANGCRHPSASTPSSPSPLSTNGTTFNGSRQTVAAAAATTSTAAAAAILLSNHRQLHNQQHHHTHTHPHHHHHHHHHVVVAAKNAAANNLSLDQGIIC